MNNERVTYSLSKKYETGNWELSDKGLIGGGACPLKPVTIQNLALSPQVSNQDIRISGKMDLNVCQQKCLRTVFVVRDTLNVFIESIQPYRCLKQSLLVFVTVATYNAVGMFLGSSTFRTICIRLTLQQQSESSC